MNPHSFLWRVVPVTALVIAVACGPAASSPQGTSAPPAAPASAAKPAAQAPAPAEPAKAAAPAQPAKPAAAPAQPAKAAAEKPAAAQSAKPAAKPGGSELRLVFGGPSQASSYYAYNVAVAKVAQAKIPGLVMTVTEGGGGQQNAQRMKQGQVHLGQGAMVSMYMMQTGIDPAFKDQPLKDMRVLWSYDPVAEVWFVREDTGITSAQQLHGKDFSGGGQGTGSEQIVRLLAFPTLGIEPKWYVGGATDALEALRSRRIVGMGKATPVTRPDALLLEALTTMKIRLLSWTPEQVQAVKAKYPVLNTTEIPAGTYNAEWNKQSVTTWQNGASVMTLADRLSEDFGYQLTKAVVEDSKLADSIQVSAFPALKGNDIVQITTRLGLVPLHAGAYKYFREIGATIPDHMKPPEAK